MTRPVYIHARPDDVAGTFHEPAAGTRRDGAVLLCPPWGWEEIASARARRVWAEQLAAAGLPTLRIDLPGCGDSAGNPRDPGRVEAWVAAIAAAAAWLRDLDGMRRVAVIGLGLSGLLARRALACSAPVEDLVLWGAPPDGRSFVRQMRAFARLTGLPPEADDDVLMAGGFALSAETVRALEASGPTHDRPGRLQRALVLDEPSPRGSAADGLDGRGVQVDVAPAHGWAEMTSHPEQSVAPTAAIAQVTAWLAAQTLPAAAPITLVPRPALMLDGGSVIETAVAPQPPGGRLAGILTQPARDAQDCCVVFLSAGAVRRCGPNRMWVEAARRLARGGIPSLRVDLASIGDADAQRAEGPWATGEFYEMDGDAQVAAVLDTLDGVASRFVLAGLCSGGYWAFRGAADPRVRGAVLVNPGALEWDSHARARDELRRLARLRDPAWWAKLARGGVDVRLHRFRSVGDAVLHGGVAAPDGHADAVRAQLDALRDSGTRVAMAFSDGEPTFEELEREGILSELDRWPDLSVEALPGEDHTLRTLAAQAALHALVDRELSRAAVAA